MADPSPLSVAIRFGCSLPCEDHHLILRGLDSRLIHGDNILLGQYQSSEKLFACIAHDSIPIDKTRDIVGVQGGPQFINMLRSRRASWMA